MTRLVRLRFSARIKTLLIVTEKYFLSSFTRPAVHGIFSNLKQKIEMKLKQSD